MAAGRARERLQAALRLDAQGQSRKAELAYRAVLEGAPREPTALMRLGLLLSARGAFDRAAPLFRRACLASPDDAAARMNLAAALLRLGDEDGAIAAYAEAARIQPDNRDVRLNLAWRLRLAHRLDEARAQYEALVERDPDDGLARWNLAALAGLEGDLDAAFTGFAHPASMRSGDLPPDPPRWRGEPLAGRRLLVESEQGLGDAIMFARLAPLVVRAGGQVILRAQPELECVLAGAEGVDRFVSRALPRPEADLWAPLGELPAIFGVRACLDAARGPYLAADPAHRDFWRDLWRERLPPNGRLRVGLVWAGGAGHPEDSLRSMALSELLAPLLAVEGVELFSLQKGPPADEADGTSLIRLDRELGDFADTAAVLEHLDLLISVDTSCLHLAGALGRPVWGLLAYTPDWRWMLNRADSPWYPSLRLFRQPRLGAWSEVAAAVAEALRRLTLA